MTKNLVSIFERVSIKPILLFSLLLALFSLPSSAQPNCELFKSQGNLKKAEACEKCYELKGLYQFSKEFQTILDEALEIDSTFAYAYRAKSVAYLKSGDFIRWKELMDKAVEYDPEGMLGYRGWCRYQFFRDYEGAISDIEELDRLVDGKIGYSATGEYHLNIAKGICYSQIGQIEKGIEIIEKQIREQKHFAGLYDYLHLAALYIETHQYEKALEALKQQEEEYDMSESAYYQSLALLELGRKEEAWEWANIASQKYDEGRRMHDGYTHPPHKIYRKDIDELIGKLQIVNGPSTSSGTKIEDGD